MIILIKFPIAYESFSWIIIFLFSTVFEYFLFWSSYIKKLNLKISLTHWREKLWNLLRKCMFKWNRKYFLSHFYLCSPFYWNILICSFKGIFCAGFQFYLLKKSLNFLLSSIYIRRKYWIRKNFRLPVFDGFTCFEMSRTRFDHF